LGCNWVIGLKIDVDEISGKGMQMFMITAVGTPVVATPLSNEFNKSGRDNLTISQEDLEIMMGRQDIIENLERKILVLSEFTWNFIVEHQVVEVAQRVLQEWPTKQSQDSQYIEIMVKKYFDTIPRKYASKELYKALSGDKGTVALSLIIELKLSDLTLIRDNFSSGDPEVCRKVMQTVTSLQEFYSQEDIERIDEIIKKIPDIFSLKAKTVKKTGILGGIKEQWLCECGNGNDSEKSYCSKCERDKYGFVSYEVNPEEAVSFLEKQRNALVVLFGSCTQ